MSVIQAPRSSGGGIGDTIGTLAQLACMVIPGAQVALPYIAAGKAINSAANGNWGGAIMNGIGMYNGGQGFNSNYNSNLVNGFKNTVAQQPIQTEYSALDNVYNSMKGAKNLSDYATGTGIKTTQMLDGGTSFGNSFGKSKFKDVWK